MMIVFYVYNNIKKIDMADGSKKTCRSWVATSFSVEFNTIDQLFTELPSGAAYICWCHERGGHTDRDHLHLYIRYKTSCRMSRIKKLLKDETAHCEMRRGTESEAANYVKKMDETAVKHGETNWWEFGQVLEDEQGQGHRSDLAQFCDEIINKKRAFSEISLERPTTYVRNYHGLEKLFEMANPCPSSRYPIKILTLIGNTDVGKTRFINEKFPDLYIVPCPTTNLWFDGYIGQKTILLDDFSDGWSLHCPITHLLRLLDPYPLRVKVSGSFSIARWTTVVITSNQDPYQWYPKATAEHLRALLRRLKSPTSIFMPQVQSLEDMEGLEMKI